MNAPRRWRCNRHIIMKLKPTNLNIRASSAEKAMLEQVAQANETTPSEMMRQLIRDAHAKMLAEQGEKKR